MGSQYVAANCGHNFARQNASDDFSVIDGPFAESKELVGGYTMVEAPDLAAACELAKRTIKMTGAGTIEVREVASVGQ